jgi:methionyl-tRNA formyltransferase
MKRLKLILCGQKSFGAAVYAALKETPHDLLAVYAPPGDKLHSHASLCGEDVRPAGTIRAGEMPEGADLLIAAHSHDYISRQVRSRLAVGAIGYHPSLLPRHRGRDAVAWTVRMGDPVAGGTVYWLGDTVDGGPIERQEWRWVLPGDTAGELWRRDLFGLGVRLLLEAVSEIAGGVIRMADQDPAVATWEPSLDGAPRMYRPELLQIGPGLSGYRIEAGDKIRRAP